MTSFQKRSWDWLMSCFGRDISVDPVERRHRFLEEALELVQACGGTPEEVARASEHVFGRPAGEMGQEVGGVMNTLSVLCSAHRLELMGEAEAELERNWEKIEKIRAKRATKPDFSAGAS